MSSVTVGLIGIVVLILVFFTGVPIAFSFFLVGLAGFCYLVSPDAGLSLLARDIYTQFTSYSLSVIPMFVLMGTFASATGIGKKLYEMAYTTIGHFRGGLAMGSVAACTGFGAVCGSTAATCATIGKIAFPEMKQYGYSDTLATGTIGAAGGLGILIPPSTSFILYGMLTEQSIGKLFISGILPGIMIAILFMVTISFLCWRDPKKGPAAAPTTWKQKLKSLLGVIDTLIVFVVTIGGMFVGWFSPTQAGAVGVACVLIIGLARREISWRGFSEAAKDGVRLSCMIMLLITGALVFGHFLTISGIVFFLSEYALSLSVHPAVIMIMICIVFFIFGFFIDAAALVVLLVPIFFPVVVGIGLDPIWFGVIVTVLCMIAVITPPVGVNVFVIKGVAKDIPLETIFKGILPFLVPFFIALALLIVFPQIATFLPSLTTY